MDDYRKLREFLREVYSAGNTGDQQHLATYLDRKTLQLVKLMEDTGSTRMVTGYFLAVQPVTGWN